MEDFFGYKINDFGFKGLASLLFHAWTINMFFTVFLSGWYKNKEKEEKTGTVPRSKNWLFISKKIKTL